MGPIQLSWHTTGQPHECRRCPGPAWAAASAPAWTALAPSLPLERLPPTRTAPSRSQLAQRVLHSAAHVASPVARALHARVLQNQTGENGAPRRRVPKISRSLRDGRRGRAATEQASHGRRGGGRLGRLGSVALRLLLLLALQELLLGRRRGEGISAQLATPPEPCAALPTRPQPPRRPPILSALFLGSCASKRLPSPHAHPHPQPTPASATHTPSTFMISLAACSLDSTPL
jgi:hypothetical protein